MPIDPIRFPERSTESAEPMARTLEPASLCPHCAGAIRSFFHRSRRGGSYRWRLSQHTLRHSWHSPPEREWQPIMVIRSFQPQALTVLVLRGDQRLPCAWSIRTASSNPPSTIDLSSFLPAFHYSSGLGRRQGPVTEANLRNRRSVPLSPYSDGF